MDSDGQVNWDEDYFVAGAIPSLQLISWSAATLYPSSLLSQMDSAQASAVVLVSVAADTTAIAVLQASLKCLPVNCLQK